MKKTFYILLTFGVFACSGEKETVRKKIIKPKREVENQVLLTPEELIYDHGGKYIERYPNGQTKIEGQKNEAGEREGYWVAFGEKGKKQSECSYSKGKKHGVIMVFHPNGKASYTGEFNMDKRVGTWKFFNSAGTLVKSEQFD